MLHPGHSVRDAGVGGSIPLIPTTINKGTPAFIASLFKNQIRTSMSEKGAKMEDIHYTKKDFKIDWYSGSGAGGQHRNKHQNCCRIIHIESGFSETC